MYYKKITVLLSYYMLRPAQKDYLHTKPLILESVFENKGNGCI